MRLILRRPGGRAAVGGGRSAGFTLIELLICVAILGILASVAYPIYTDQVRSARVADGRAALANAAARLERCYTQNHHYDHCSDVEGPSEQGHYVVELTAQGGHYQLTAKAVAASAVSPACATLSTNQTGATAPRGCW